MIFKTIFGLRESTVMRTDGQQGRASIVKDERPGFGQLEKQPMYNG